MSYARCNATDSQVYVYRDAFTGGYECCDDMQFDTPGEMLLHLLFHRAGAFAGRKVPQSALNRLADEDAEQNTGGSGSSGQENPKGT
jgi:hypothetical protein